MIDPFLIRPGLTKRNPSLHRVLDWVSRWDIRQSPSCFPQAATIYVGPFERRREEGFDYETGRKSRLTKESA
jgi:hypothetical protein